MGRDRRQRAGRRNSFRPCGSFRKSQILPRGPALIPKNILQLFCLTLCCWDTISRVYPAEMTEKRNFETFMQAYQNMVFSAASRLLGNDTEAQDIAQEVFLRAYEHYDE